MIILSLKFKQYILMLTFIVSSIIASAFSKEADSLEYYLRYAANNNNLIKSEFALYQASLQKIRQSGAISDPQLDMGFFIKPMDNIDGSQIADIKIMQMFPWFGTRKAARTEAQHMSKMAYEKFRLTRDDLFYQIYNQWFILCNLNQRLLNIQENIKIMENLKELVLRRFAGSNSVEMAGSSAGMSDVLRIQLEIEEFLSKVKSMNSEIQTAKITFNALIGRSLKEDIVLPDKFEKLSSFYENDETVLATIMSHNPMLNMLSEEASSFKARGEMDKKMSYPMFGIGLNYSLIKKRANDGMGLPQSQMNGKDMIMPMISITLPVWRNKYNSRQNESQLYRESSNERLSSTQKELAAQYFTLKHQINDADRKIKLYLKQTELANTTYNIIVQEFSTGKSNLTNVLQVQQQLLNYRLMQSEAVAEYNTIIASLNRLMSKIELD